MLRITIYKNYQSTWRSIIFLTNSRVSTEVLTEWPGNYVLITTQEGRLHENGAIVRLVIQSLTIDGFCVVLNL